MIQLYRFLMMLTTPLLLIFGAFFSAKIREGLRLRRQLLNFRTMTKIPSCYWIHAASGEYEYARPLIVELKKQDPTTPIVVTVFSPTYLKAVQNDPLVDHVFPLPLDLPGSVRSFISKINPKIVFFARTDLWPELITQLTIRKIPTVLFSFFQNPSQGRGQRFFKSWMLRQLTWIDGVESSTKNWLSSLGLKNVSLSGDTRYDQVIDRLNRLKPLPFEWNPHSKTLVLGSTWPEDEKVLIAALAQTCELWDKVFIAPHEPSETHLKNLEIRFQQVGLHTERFSQIKSQSEHKIILVDKVGWLMSLYQWGQVAFVGGSFKGSTHSVMEPLAHGLPVLVGPFISNNAEALEFQSRFVYRCVDEKEIVTQIKQLLNLDAQQREDLRQKIQKNIQSQSGASARLIDVLKKQNLV